MLLRVLSNCPIEDESILPGPLVVTETGERVEALETALNDDPRPLSSSIPSYCSNDNIKSCLDKKIFLR